MGARAHTGRHQDIRQKAGMAADKCCMRLCNPITALQITHSSSLKDYNPGGGAGGAGATFLDSLCIIDDKLKSCLWPPKSRAGQSRGHFIKYILHIRVEETRTHLKARLDFPFSSDFSWAINPAKSNGQWINLRLMELSRFRVSLPGLVNRNELGP